MSDRTDPHQPRRDELLRRLAKMPPQTQAELKQALAAKRKLIRASRKRASKSASAIFVAAFLAAGAAHAQSWEYRTGPYGTPPPAAYEANPYAPPPVPGISEPPYSPGWENSTSSYQEPPPQIYEPDGGARSNDGHCLAIAAGC